MFFYEFFFLFKFHSRKPHFIIAGIYDKIVVVHYLVITLQNVWCKFQNGKKSFEHGKIHEQMKYNTGKIKTFKHYMGKLFFKTKLI